MTYTDKHIVENYFRLIESLSSVSKMELIEKLKKSLKTENKTVEDKFFKTFGAFDNEKSSDEIIAELKESRKFRKKEINF
jgi:hypothetical protein